MDSNEILKQSSICYMIQNWFSELVSQPITVKEAYDLIISKEASLGIVLEYPNNSTTDLSILDF